jgi:hypothetical protein
MFSHGRGILNVGIGAFAFLLTCAGLNTLLSSPETDRVVPNLKFFREHRDDFDTIFVGSSHVHHQIAPAIFDQTMSAAGHPTHAFNFGLNAMMAPENFYVVDRIMKTRPRNLKWVFIELCELETKTRRTSRAVYWHDWKRTALVLRAILDAPLENGAEKRNLLFLHSVLFAENFANVGQRRDLARWVRRLWKKGSSFKDIGPNKDGYSPLNKEMKTAAASDEAELQVARESELRFVSPLIASAYRELADDVRRSGAVPIFLVTPNVTQTRLGFGPEAAVGATVLSFNNAKEYPQLYRKEMRVDSDHLNGAGSEYFTKLLAEDFLQRLRQNQIR